jgi:hypothetical protein
MGISDKSSKFFVISALLAPELKPLNKILRNARRHRFKKELRSTSEVKANSSSSSLRTYLINEMNQLKNSSAFHCVVDKKINKNKIESMKRDEFYNSVAATLAGIIKINSSNVEVRVDRGTSKQTSREKFNISFCANLKSNSRVGTVSIYHSYSEKFSGIQLVDLLAWVVYRRFNNNDLSYFNKINTSLFPQKIIEYK